MMPGSEESDGAAAATATTGTATEGGGRGGRGGGPTLGLKKGPWTAAEDAILMDYVKKHGEGNWNAVQKNSGLSRCGKSCRLRWANHLRPNLKKGSFSPEEERLILELHAKLGNKWARMAAQMPGRTDNEIKNYWNTRIKRRQRAGLPLYPPDIQRQAHNHHRTPAMVPALSDCKAHLTPAPAVSSPLTLFDPMNFSATGTTNLILGLNHHNSFLSPPTSAHRMKRLCDENLKFSLPFSAPNPPPLLTSGFQYRNYDLNPPLMTLSPQQQRHQQSLSVKTELPSSQFFPEPGASTGGDPLSWSNSGLLDALLLQNSSALGDYNCGDSGDLRRGVLPEPPMEDVKWENGEDSGGSLRSPVLESADTLENSQTPLPKSADTWKCSRSPALKSADVWENMTSPVPTSADTWESLTSPILKSSDTWENCKSPAPKCDDGWDSSNSFIGIKLKSGPMDEIQSVNEDVSTMLGIPVSATKGAREWFNNDRGEASNGQSSVVTDDDLGLEMQQLASSMAMEVEDHTWSIGSCHWNNMPGIC